MSTPCTETKKRAHARTHNTCVNKGAAGAGRVCVRACACGAPPANEWSASCLAWYQIGLAKGRAAAVSAALQTRGRHTVVGVSETLECESEIRTKKNKCRPQRWRCSRGETAWRERGRECVCVHSCRQTNASQSPPPKAIAATFCLRDLGIASFVFLCV